MECEHDLQRKVLAYLATRPGVWAMRVNAGSVRRNVRGAPKGTADIIGCAHGRFFAMELKAPRGKLSPEQDLWARRIRRLGGVVRTIRSVEEAEQMLDEVIG